LEAVKKVAKFAKTCSSYDLKPQKPQNK